MIILSHQHPPLPLQAPMAWPPAWGGERGPSDTIPPNPAFKGTQGAYHCLQEVCVPLPCPVKFSFPPRRLGVAGRPQAHCLPPVTSDYASTICRSSKTLCSPPTTTSQLINLALPHTGLSAAWAMYNVFLSPSFCEGLGSKQMPSE